MNDSLHREPTSGDDLALEELNALPLSVRDYILRLRQEIAFIRDEKASVDRQLADAIRKRNWSKARNNY